MPLPIPAVLRWLAAVAVLGGSLAAQENADLEGIQREVRVMVEEVRGQSFKEAVPMQRLTADQSRAFLRRKMDQEYPAEAIAAEQAAYRHFGLLRPGENLESLFVELMVERAAGFYDPEAGRLFLVEGQSWRGPVVAHELAHALQDQIFDVDRMLRAARGDDDRLRAVQAMIEGEAMWVAGRVAARPAASRLMRDLERAAPPSSSDRQAGPGERSIGSFPDVLQAELSFPYTAGLAWTEAIVSGPAGISRLNDLFREPVDSSEQILHPAKSLAPRDLPTPPPRTALPDLTQDGYRLAKIGTWGEFGMRLVLLPPEGDLPPAASEGWDGDLFGVYSPAEGGTVLVWLTIWDTGNDAAEFEISASTWMRGRHASRDGFSIERRSAAVVIVEGLEPAVAARAMGSVWEAWPDREAKP
ncbi:MAG: hypothetical protein ACREAA_15040 [Candidatus Polarisedimenticolia bacterium]